MWLPRVNEQCERSRVMLARRSIKTEMQVSNRTLMETLTQINARLTRLEEAGSRSQESDGRGVHPPATVDAAANLSRGISRYRDIELDRNTAGEDRWDRIECSVYDGFNMSMNSDKNRLKEPLDQLKKLQQIGSVEDYMQNFEKARFQSECSESVALELFLEGLNEKLHCLVNLHTPRTVREAFDYATFFEKTLNPNIDYRHCPRFADENGNRAEPLDMVKADECCYQLLVAMVEHVWSGKVLELMLDGWNFSSSGVDLLLVKARTVGVAWDFKKRKKSLRQLVGVLVNNGKIQEQVCFLREVDGTAVQKCKEEDIGISVAEVLNLKLMCHE